MKIIHANLIFGSLTLALINLNATSVSRAAGADDVMDFALLDVKPKLTKPVMPTYPYNQSRAGVNGMVAMEFIIDTTGQVRNPSVVESNNPAFERPALDAVLQWKFSPGLKMATR